MFFLLLLFYQNKKLTPHLNDSSAISETGSVKFGKQFLNYRHNIQYCSKNWIFFFKSTLGSKYACAITGCSEAYDQKLCISNVEISTAKPLLRSYSICRAWKWKGKFWFKEWVKMANLMVEMCEESGSQIIFLKILVTSLWCLNVNTVVGHIQDKLHFNWLRKGEMQHTEKNALIKLCVFVNSEGWRNIDQEFLIIKNDSGREAKIKYWPTSVIHVGSILGKCRV